jgi:sterol desaturase/sphingolipid hydroxylase (fatty acid hydroxylase superfamily)
MLRVVETVDAHSGFRFPFSPFSLLPFQGGSERHFFHHSHNVGSFGSFFNYWDRITGTDRAFLEFQKEEARKENLKQQ